MSSAINTNGIDVNYPTPGVNNNSQGFRDNFSAITTNLNTAATEITDLQNKVVLKSPLDGTVLNNDMGNALISNAAVRGFRSTTYNLGSSLSGTVLVNAALGDVQYGTVAGNVSLTFGSWAPVNTQSTILLKLNISNSSAVITFPSQVVASNNNFGGTILENYANIANVITVTAPHNVSELDFKLTTIDCGNTISIEPLNRPYQSTQIVKRTPPSTGQTGDKVGTVCVDASINQLHVTSTNAADYFSIATGNTSQLYPGQAVVFTGTSFEANITAGTTYYIRNVVSSSSFTVSSSTSIASNVNLAGSTGNMYLDPVSYMYVATANYSANSYNRNISNTASPNIITVSGSTANLVVNYPIIFTGDSTGNTGNLQVDTVYYIKSVAGNDITVSRTRYNGVAGPEYDSVTTVTAGNVDIDYTVYDGPDIFRRVQLNSY